MPNAFGGDQYDPEYRGKRAAKAIYGASRLAKKGMSRKKKQEFHPENVGTVRGVNGCTIVIRRSPKSALLLCTDPGGEHDDAKYTLLYLTPKAIAKIQKLLKMPSRTRVR